MRGLGAGFGESGLCGQRITGGSRLIVGYVLCIARLCAVTWVVTNHPASNAAALKRIFLAFTSTLFYGVTDDYLAKIAFFV